MASLRFKIESYDVLVSTQGLMKERIKAGEDVHGMVIQAQRQCGGVGQQGKPWQSQRGGSYQTLACRWQDVTPQASVTLSLALGIVQCLEVYGVKAQIKWPNDIYYRDKKLAGILCEHVSRYLVIGVGMNVNNPVPANAIGLRGWDLSAAHMIVLEGLQLGLNLKPSSLQRHFADYDWLAHKSVSLKQHNYHYHGVAQGIDRNGALIISIAGKPQHFVTGSISHVGQ